MIEEQYLYKVIKITSKLEEGKNPKRFLTLFIHFFSFFFRVPLFQIVAFFTLGIPSCT